MKKLEIHNTRFRPSHGNQGNPNQNAQTRCNDSNRAVAYNIIQNRNLNYNLNRNSSNRQSDRRPVHIDLSTDEVTNIYI